MSSRHARKVRQPSLLERLRSLTGWKRTVLMALMGVGVVGLLTAAGGTAFAIEQENQDAFCASCHTQPETKYLQQSSATPAVSLAAFHAAKSVRCIDCHSGSGPFGRVSGLTQGAIDLMAYDSGHFHAPAVTLSKLSDDSCIKCHQQVMNSRTFDNHFHYFLSRWQSVDSSAAHCIDCHVSHPTTGDPTQQFLQTQTVQATCNNCLRAVGR